MQFWVNPNFLKMLSHPDPKTYDPTTYTFKINDWIDPATNDKCYNIYYAGNAESIITSITINGKTICEEEPITTTTLTATREPFTLASENSKTTTRTNVTTTTPTDSLAVFFYESITFDWQDGKFIECNK